MDIVRKAVPELIEFGELRRPVLGISMIPPRYLNRLGITGVGILEVFDGGAADRAGLQPIYRDQYGRSVLGDVIKEVNGQKINGREDLLLEIEKYQPGDEILLTIERQEGMKEIPLILQAPQR